MPNAYFQIGVQYYWITWGNEECFLRLGDKKIQLWLTFKKLEISQSGTQIRQKQMVTKM